MICTTGQVRDSEHLPGTKYLPCYCPDAFRDWEQELLKFETLNIVFSDLLAIQSAEKCSGRVIRLF